MNEVVLLEPDEWSAHREIRLAALTDAPEAFGSTLERERTLTETEWRGRLQSARTFHGKQEGKALATATGLALPDGDAHLVGVWAHPSVRGTGLAADVVHAVLAWARAENRPRVWAWVAEGNSRADRFYVKLGFHRAGDQQALPKDPSRRDVLLVAG